MSSSRRERRPCRAKGEAFLRMGEVLATFTPADFKLQTIDQVVVASENGERHLLEVAMTPGTSTVQLLPSALGVRQLEAGTVYSVQLQSPAPRRRRGGVWVDTSEAAPAGDGVCP